MARTSLRLNLNLTQKSADALDALVDHTDLSMTEVVNRALQLYQYWVSAEAAGGAWHVVQDGQMTEVKILN
jgi:hypothetical protein